MRSPMKTGFFRLEPWGKYERLALPKGWDGDGIIARVTHHELAHQITGTKKPAVNVSWYSFDAEHIPSCTADEVLGGRMIADHFLERGFRQFAYCGPMNRPSFTDMFGRAFVNAICDTGLTCHSFDEKGSSPKSVGKKEMALNFLNRSSGSTKGVRPFHRHHHIVLTGVKTNAMAKTEGAQGSL